MKTTHHLKNGFPAVSRVLQPRPLRAVALKTDKKILLISILLSFTFFSSFSQRSTGLLTRYDSCHVRAPARPIMVSRQGLRSGSAIVRLAYVIPSNRVVQPDGVSHLQHVIQRGQEWYRAQLEQNGFGSKTFEFETESDGVTPLIHVVNVPETDDFLREDIWGRTTQAVVNAGIPLWANGEVWVVIPEVHVMLPDGSVAGGVALGANAGTGDSPGVAMLSSNALPLFDPAMMTDDTSYDGRVLPALGPFPMKQNVTFAEFEGTTYSSLASSWVGSLIHEMGHAFGLAHDFRNDTNFHGNLMGNGLRGMRGSLFPEKYPQDYTRLEYASALMLNVSHFFNTESRVTSSPDVSCSSPGSVTPRKGLVRIAFQATDSDSLSLAHLLHEGNTVAELKLQGTTVDTLFAIPYYTQGETNSYTLGVHDKQGNTTYYDIRFSVPGGYNQAPIPFIRVDPPVPGLNQPITLDASWSSGDESTSALFAAWDVDNDGQFDTTSINKIIQYRYENGGNYLIRLTLKDGSGAETISTAVSITIPGEKKIAVEGFSLINADNDAVVSTLKQGMDVSLLAWEGKSFSVRGNTSNGTISRVEFDLQGPITHQQTDREQPYALFGDDPQGNFIGKKLVPGNYTLTATPYSPSGKGIACTVSFRVIDKSVPGQATIVSDKTMGGIGEEIPFSLIAATDGGYLLGGYSSSNISGDKSENGKGDEDYWIVKVDAQYNKVWDRTFGGNKGEELRSIVAAPDGGGYLLAGFSSSDVSGDKSQDGNGGSDYWVVKIDNQGNKVWDKTFGGSGIDVLFSAVSTLDGGYLFGGFSESDASGDKSENNKGDRDYWVVKIDNLGNKVWDKTFGGSGAEELRCILMLSEGSYLLGGTSNSDVSGDKSEPGKGSSDEWLLQIDSQGNKVWDKTIGGSDAENLVSIIHAPDDGYLLAGYSSSNASGDKSENSKGTFDYWVVKVDAEGNKIWDRTLGGGSTDGIASAIPIPEGGYVLAGYSISNASGDKSGNGFGNWDYWVVKIDAEGNKVWDRTAGGSDDDEILSGIRTPEGRYLLAGISRSDISPDKSENSKGAADYWIVEMAEPRSSVVTGFTLMNAHTNKEIKTLQSGDVIRLREVGNILLDIRANTNGEKLLKVTFDLAGPMTFHQTESVSPYALFGDIAGEFNGRKLPPGVYSLTVTAYASDTEKVSQAISFTVIERVKPVVVSLTLMNAHTSQEIKDLQQGAVVNLKHAGRLLDIRANVTGDQIKKVTFTLSGPMTHYQTETTAPYALFGDIQGDFNGRNFLPGTYSLTVTAYATDKEKSSLTVSFTVTDRILPAVASLTLMNAHTNQEIKKLNDRDVIRLSEVGDRLLDVRANVTDQRINKVTFDLRGPITFQQTETVIPYALFGDIEGAYNGRKLPTGSYTLTVTPYVGDRRGTPYVITFAVTREVSTARRASVEVYPIPASDAINIRHQETTTQSQMTLRDFNGNLVLHRPLSKAPVEKLDVSNFRKGVYYLMIVSPEGEQIIRMVVE